MFRCMLTAVVVLCMVSAAPAVVITTFQNGVSPAASYAGTDDTHLWQNWPNDAWGGWTSGSLIGNYASVARSLVKFDVSSIAPGTPVSAAKIRLNMTVANPLAVDVYQVLKQWTRSGATWNNASAGNPWTAPGCDGVGTDRAASPLTTVNFTAADLNNWVEIALPVSLVQGWVDGTATNAGVLFKAFNEASSSVRFYNETATNVALRPMLVVETVPEPMTLLLLAVSGMAAVRRRAC